MRTKTARRKQQEKRKMEYDFADLIRPLIVEWNEGIVRVAVQQRLS